MKNPRAQATGAFPLTLDARLDTSFNARKCPDPSTEIFRDFNWCPVASSVQPVRTRRGALRHE